MSKKTGTACLEGIVLRLKVPQGAPLLSPDQKTEAQEGEFPLWLHGEWQGPWIFSLYQLAFKLMRNTAELK